MEDKSIAKRLVTLKQFLVRAYGWIQVPGMILMMVGILSPYVKQVVDIETWIIAIIAFVGLIVVGFLDSKLGLHKAEMNYGINKSKLLLSRFDNIDRRLEELKLSINTGSGKQ